MKSSTRKGGSEFGTVQWHLRFFARQLGLHRHA